jgi:lysophospholipase L1-like esterase
MRRSCPLAFVFLALAVAAAPGLAPVWAAAGPPRLLLGGDSTIASYEKPSPNRPHFSRKDGRGMVALVADKLPAGVPELRPSLRVRPRLTLPPVLYAVPGVETAVYFANAALFKEPGLYRFRVKCPVGQADAVRWAFTPRPDEVGDHLLRLEALDADGKPVEEASCRVRVTAEKAGAGKPVTLLLVGDSLTHGTLYPNELARLLSGPGNPAWKMLGTHRPDNAAPGVAHEGYGGWTWERFVQRWAAGSPATGIERNSPFVFPSPDGGAPVLEVARYFREQCGDRRPDTVLFMLGINDCFSLNPDDPAALDGGIDWVLKQAETLLAAFRKAAPDAELGICLTTPPNSRDAAFEAIYKGRFPRWGWRRIQHRLVEREIAQFGGREKERIFLVPTALNLDPVGGYPDYSDVHPNAAGYRQVGASVYAWLKARLQARAGL